MAIHFGYLPLPARFREWVRLQEKEIGHLSPWCLHRSPAIASENMPCLPIHHHASLFPSTSPFTLLERWRLLYRLYHSDTFSSAQFACSSCASLGTWNLSYHDAVPSLHSIVRFRVTPWASLNVQLLLSRQSRTPAHRLRAFSPLYPLLGQGHRGLHNCRPLFAQARPRSFKANSAKRYQYDLI